MHLVMKCIFLESPKIKYSDYFVCNYRLQLNQGLLHAIYPHLDESNNWTEPNMEDRERCLKCSIVVTLFRLLSWPAIGYHQPNYFARVLEISKIIFAITKRYLYTFPCTRRYLYTFTSTRRYLNTFP